MFDFISKVNHYLKYAKSVSEYIKYTAKVVGSFADWIDSLPVLPDFPKSNKGKAKSEPVDTVEPVQESAQADRGTSEARNS